MINVVNSLDEVNIFQYAVNTSNVEEVVNATKAVGASSHFYVIRWHMSIFRTVSWGCFGNVCERQHRGDQCLRYDSNDAINKNLNECR